jgi:diguanylate cyclase (GGDEF)-like protein
VFSVLSLGHRESNAPARRSSPALIWVVYGILALLLLAYFISLVVRSPQQTSTLVDGWMVVAFELIATCLCLARGFTLKRGRAIPLVLGCGLLAWTLGDFALTYETLGGQTAPTPSLADLCYLSFYPLAYVGLVLIMRREIGKLAAATWLDGAVAGVGAAAVCACFAFTAILHSVGGSPPAVATNLAYPVGDLLLLALVFGGAATMPGRPTRQWMLLGVAFAVIAVGDTFNLLNTTGAPTQLDSVLNGIAWPTAILLTSTVMWLKPGPVNLLTHLRAPGFVLPGLGAVASLSILFVGTQHHVSGIAISLAMATLVLVGARLALSVTRLRALTEERHRQSVTDQLTGLGNRRQLVNLFNTYFADELDSRTPDQQLAFLFMDLDHFKEINDSFGHSAGDELLRQLGPRLKGALRATDVLVRLGGDELGVVIMNEEADYAATVAHRLLRLLEEPFLLDTVSVRISASIGAARAPVDASDGAGLMRCADLAMYRAKLRDSKFEIYQKEIDDEGNRLRLVEELKLAVERRDFTLSYQPQLDLRTGGIPAVEALLRWPHPRLGLVAPMDFLPLAEEAGLMRALTTLVLDQALSQCAAWRSSGLMLAVAVNISVTNLLDPEFVPLVRSRLSHHQLPPSSLILEITETTVIRDFEGCRAVIAQLRELGAAVSIDDFGAGFTSLAYLANLAVSELKLDRTFITGITNGNERDLALVRATITLAHSLGLRVVAEGIEDSNTLNLLTGVGCDLAQGYFIGRPVAPAQLVLRPDLIAPGVAVAELAAS